jgi:hypothetical protein
MACALLTAATMHAATSAQSCAEHARAHLRQRRPALAALGGQEARKVKGGCRQAAAGERCDGRAGPRHRHHPHAGGHGGGDGDGPGVRDAWHASVTDQRDGLRVRRHTHPEVQRGTRAACACCCELLTAHVHAPHAQDRAAAHHHGHPAAHLALLQPPQHQLLPLPLVVLVAAERGRADAKV